jgi:heme-degrading monooxygenase HmoA
VAFVANPIASARLFRQLILFELNFFSKYTKPGFLSAIGEYPTEFRNHKEPPMPQSPLADTPAPPYYAVVFSSLRTPVDEGYGAMAERMLELAAQQPGYLGVESARDDKVGITVSYWSSLDAIRAWKAHAEHLEAQRLGHTQWYSAFRLRVARVERDYRL